jgi:hypothetical protein
MLLHKLLVPLIAGLFIAIVPMREAHSYRWLQFEGHEYSLTSQWQSWDENQAEAVTQGGYLAVINSVDENEWLTHAFAHTYQRDGPWNVGDPGWKSLVDIGYYQASDGTWRWINGEAGVNNPSQFYYEGTMGIPFEGTNAFLHVEGHYFPGTWNNAPYITHPEGQGLNLGYGYEPAFGVIERLAIPEPADIFLLAISIGGLALVARAKGSGPRSNDLI